MLVVSGNQFWERLKDLLVHGPLQALLAAVINISILNLGNLTIEGYHGGFIHPTLRRGGNGLL
jgi:hypothetical protein